MNVSLTPELDRFIAEKVESGLYSSNSEVVREALRLLRYRDLVRRHRPRARQTPHAPERPRRSPEPLARLRARRDDILLLARRHGATNVRVFGSVVRGAATSGSDVDFLVDMEPGRSLLDRAALLVDLSDLLACTVDVATEPSLKERIREKVLQEAVSL